MLIVLEGLDGAGKSTQVELIKEFYASRNREVKFLHFPRFDSPIYGGLIASFLRGDFGSVESVHPKLVALLFAGDRGDAAYIIKSWIEQGYIVILDRYYYSNIAFQCAKVKDLSQREELRNWIIDTELTQFSIPKPDINLFLDVPISFVKERLNESREGADREYLKGKSDIHEADISFQESVREIYLMEVAKGPDLIRIDCSTPKGDMASPTEIFSKVITYLREF